MITWFFGAQTSDGKKHETLADAQAWELALIVACGGPPTDNARETCRMLVEKSAQAVDVLTTTKSSRTKARAIHGGTKPRKVKQTEALTK